MPHVLIVDQDSHIRRLARQVLERAGYSIAEAAEYGEVAERMQERMPDIIVLDCLLGGYGLGLDLLREIRATPHTCRIPVVVTTGIPEADIDARMHQCGATAYLLKPFGPRELLQAVAIAGGIDAAASVPERALAR